MDNSCCKDCTDRWVNETGRCHSTCERYAAFLKEMDERRKAADMERNLNAPLGYGLNDPLPAKKKKKSRRIYIYHD